MRTRIVPLPCLERGCTEYVYDGSRCPRHYAAAERVRLANGGTGRRGSSHEWRKLRERAISRDDRKCCECGVTGSLEAFAGRALTVHHIDGDARHNRLNNLQTLCVSCHRNLTKTDKGN